MTDPWLLVAGGLLVAFVVYDFVRTTMSMSGLGPGSSVVTYTLWHGARRLVPWAERRLGLRARAAIGPVILSVVATFWIVLHLIGYTLMYAAGASLVDSNTGAPATLLDQIAFVGASFSTLGASTVQPTNGWWDVLSMLAALNGMILLTLSVSFILSVLQIIGAARGLAVRYRAIAASVATSPSHAKLTKLASLGPDLCQLAIDLRGSPLPGVFAPSDPTLSFPEAVAELCDLVDDGGLSMRQTNEVGDDIAELHYGLRLLGGPLLVHKGVDDVNAARAWANAHRLL